MPVFPRQWDTSTARRTPRKASRRARNVPMPPNERLRVRLEQSGNAMASFSEHVGTDPKSVAHRSVPDVFPAAATPTPLPKSLARTSSTCGRSPGSPAQNQRPHQTEV